MGTVIHLSRGRLRRETFAPAVNDSGRVALVLGGGGITGAAYHLGVLNAMNAMSDRASVNDFDLYVGTSAGAVIASCLANGITPEELILANLDHELATIPGIRADEIMRPDRRGLIRSMARWPLGVVGALRRYIGHPFTTSIVDGLGAIAEGLPAALYTTDGTERYMRKLLETGGRTNRFGETRRKLLVTATDLDTAQRVVFGEPDTSDVDISEAAAASTAIPLMYAPRKINGREYLDGGLRSTTNIEVAIAHGATLIVAVNPLVPYVHDVNHLLPSATGLPARYVSEKGFPHIAAQTFRIMAQAQQEKELELISYAHPEVDIILIEPRRDDEHLFVFNLMDYASRERIARHAFENVAIDLVTRFPEYKKVLGRHGIKIKRDLLIEQLQTIVEGSEPRFFEARSDEPEVESTLRATAKRRAQNQA
ncbi:MAG TPA: patatin-like phospholipase family protein [Actinomycetota bacterium]|nr:patatin-like phospholipase family protein [Actinomycetota bacterium]